MKTTIFTRMLLATLGPLLLVFVLILAITGRNIHNICSSFALQTSSWEAEYAADHLVGKLGGIFRAIDVVDKRLGELAYPGDDIPERMEALLGRLMDVAPELSNVWAVFEPGVVGEGYVSRTWARDAASGARKPDILVPDIVKNPDRAPWQGDQVVPGVPYVDMSGAKEYGIYPRLVPGISIVVPILREGDIVGALGGEVSYRDLFDSKLLLAIHNGQVNLISRDGGVCYSGGAMRKGMNVFDGEFQDNTLGALKNAIARREAWTGEGRLPDSREDFLIYMKPVPGFGIGDSLFLYLTTPLGSLYSVTRSAVQSVVWAGVLGFLLLGASVFAAAGSLVRPIRSLIGDFEKVAAGDLEHIVQSRETETGNIVELHILRAALTRMLQQIAQTHALRLEAAAEHLEKEKVKAELQARSEFFSRMSHEIRTPMNAVMGITEILLRRDSLAERDKKHVSDIKVSAEYLLTIVNDIFEFSQLESGEIVLCERNFNLRRLLDSMRSTGEILAAPNSLSFFYKEEGNLPTCLYGDESRLRQILLIFLDNACKFTSEGHVALTVGAGENLLTFTISDTGRGMKEEDMAAIFEPFKRIETAGNSALSGTGLGLAVAAGLLDKMGGTVSVESEYGRGSTFTISLPMVSSDQAIPSDILEQGGAFVAYRPGVKILLVDDNEINLSVAETLLSEFYGFECELAHSGEEALRKCAATEYKLIFMDQMMPEMDGLETTRRIRESGGRNAEVPIIALTANAVHGAREMLLAAGMNDYLTKPVQVEELDAVLARWIPNEWKTLRPVHAPDPSDTELS
jgi:signal transduction histidine kinase/ActR/RegA family two-component response regulator